MRVEWNGEKLIGLQREAVFLAVHAGAIVVQKKIKQLLNQKASNRSNGGIPSAPGQPPAKATGTLARSIAISADGTMTKAGGTTGSVVATDGNKIFTHIGTALEYARIHELGGIIKAKNKKYLAIPVSKEAKRASAQGLSAREFGKQLVPIKTKNQIVLAEPETVKITSGGKRTTKLRKVHYVLKKSVTMPKRPYIRPGFAQSREACAKAMKDTIIRVMKKR